MKELGECQEELWIENRAFAVFVVLEEVRAKQHKAKERVLSVIPEPFKSRTQSVPRGGLCWEP